VTEEGGTPYAPGAPVARVEPKTIGQVVGENLARLRAARGQTQREAARFLEVAFVPWTYAMIASLESGRRASIDPESLLLLSATFSVPVTYWFEGEGEVRLNEDYTISRAHLRKALRGARDRQEPPTVTAESVRASIHTLNYASFGPMDADLVLSKRFGVQATDVLRAALALWGHPATVERDRRLGNVSGLAKDTVRSRRGHVTRQLAKELEPHLSAS
jgi:transcriptional regulator with XRE-family HTH domain